MSEHLDQLRAVVRETPEAPSALGGYLAKVHARAYTVLDSDVAALRDAGITEDEIFEQTVATAIGEGLQWLDAAMRVIG